MYNSKEKDAISITFIICLIAFILSTCLADAVTKKTKYSTDEYWVAKDYHHVYEKYSGEIVDVISKNEKCTIKGDEIIVISRNKSVYTFSIIIAILSGLSMATIIILEIYYSLGEIYTRK